MRVLTGMKKQVLRRPVALAAGFFDGIHKGHRKVISRTISAAKNVGGEAWLLTFDTHPLRVLDPESAPLLLTSNEHKLNLLQRLNLDGCMLIPFSRDLADMEPRCFVDELRAAVPSLKEILVGKNWRFGRHGKGNASELRRLGVEAGIRVTAVSPVTRKGGPISSTRIRAEIMAGHLDEAAAMLGRLFSVLGTVVEGRTVGRQLGYPTANLDSHNEVLPPCGVYAVHAMVDNRIMDGVLNRGFSPTFGRTRHDKPGIELHLLDRDIDLYGQDIEVFFVRKLRNEKTFSSREELRTQIALDTESTRCLLEAKKRKESLYTHYRPVL